MSTPEQLRELADWHDESARHYDGEGNHSMRNKHLDTAAALLRLAELEELGPIAVLNSTQEGYNFTFSTENIADDDVVIHLYRLPEPRK